MDELPKLTDEQRASLEELDGTEGGTDKCWLAMKAAWDTLGEYCGGKNIPIDIEGMSLSVPVDVITTARAHPDMSHDERVEMVAHTEWCRTAAGQMCEQIFGAERDSPTLFECIENVAIRIAKKIVG